MQTYPPPTLPCSSLGIPASARDTRALNLLNPVAPAPSASSILVPSIHSTGAYKRQHPTTKSTAHVPPRPVLGSTQTDDRTHRALGGSDASASAQDKEWGMNDAWMQSRVQHSRASLETHLYAIEILHLFMAGGNASQVNGSHSGDPGIMPDRAGWDVLHSAVGVPLTLREGCGERVGLETRIPCASPSCVILADASDGSHEAGST
ncbi:hypothetical protein B0H19DRAFT_1250617 [Mycena capillaripes]|nr:hypothetical protein B0H19DRAFT_1250617 [Mycena capillaripes]